jgi:hypothetical protein
MSDHNINEAYQKCIQPKVVEKSEEQLDEAITSGVNDIMKYVNNLDFNKNPSLSPSDKKKAQRKAGEIQMHIQELVQGMIDMEEILSSFLSPGFEKVVRNVIKKQDRIS